MYPFKYLTIVLIVVALTGFGNIKSAAWVAVLIGVIDTAGRFLMPALGAFFVYFVLIGMMLWRNHKLPPSSGSELAAGFESVTEKTGVTMPKGGRSDRLLWHRVRPSEIIYWSAAVLVFFLFPQYLAFATSVLVTALFVLSLDLILGFAGIITLGHALYYGFGAYVTGLATFAGWHEPISGALLGGLSAAVLAAITGPVVLRLTGLPLIMVTLALGALAFEAANKLTWLTGGDDGLFGIVVAPLLGVFPWTMFAHTAYWYVLGWTFLLFLLARSVIASPFGVANPGNPRQQPTHAAHRHAGARKAGAHLHHQRIYRRRCGGFIYSDNEIRLNSLS